MRKYRIGNDIPLVIQVLTNGERVSLDGRDLKVCCQDAFGKDVPVEWLTTGCEVNATIRGRNQHSTGVFIVTLVENDGLDDMRTVDVRTVEIVPHSWQLDNTDTGEGLRVTVNLETTISVAEIERIRAVVANETARVEAEAERSSAERQRAEGENQRDQAYQQAEASRNGSFNESQQSRQSDYETAEGNRNQAYQQAEESRNSSFDESQQTRQSRYETAEGNRDQAYQQAEESRGSSFRTAETERNAAETRRQEAEEARASEYKQMAAEIRGVADKAAEAAQSAADAQAAAQALSGTVSQVDTNTNDITDLKSRVTDLEFEQSDYYVEAYEPGTTDAVPVHAYGNKALLKQFDFILLDTSDNTGEVTHKAGVLQRNNLLRFKDGAWAPVVGITAAQAADAQLELYALASGEYVQYCEAGAYDAEAYVEEVLRPWYAGTLEAYDGPQLYKSDGEGGYVEAHALCPWETTETKYTIGIGAQHRLYVLDNVIGESGKVWKGLFLDKTEWDGIDLTPYALEPTAISPCPVCTILEDGVHKTRSFFYLHSGDTNCNGATGINGTFNMFAPGDRTYPRTLDVGQTTNMNWARANNADAESPVPFAEGGYFALDAFVIAQELLYSRRNPFRASQFGSGISANDACNSETTWRTNGGVRYRRSDADSPSYAPFSSNAAVYYMDGSTAKRTDWSNTLNKYAPKEQCMESQIVASFAAEFGLPATTDATAPLYFEVYGGRYYYMNVQDAQGLEDGYMNVRIYRELEQTGTAWRDAEGNPVEYDIAVVLRMSLFAGANISGDIYAYWGGGCEVVGTCGEATGNNTTGHVMDGYLQPDQSKWMHETTISLPNHGRFAFEAEDAYPHLGTWLNKATGYAIQRNAYLPSRSKAGGSMSQGECYYSYEGKYWSSTVGTRVRVGLRFRGSAHFATCSPRHWYAYYGASFANRFYGGSAQARFE